MSGVVFATAAEDVKIWDGINFNLKHHISKPLTSISHVSWSPNGQWLGTASSNADKVVVHYFKKHSSFPLELKPSIPQTGMRFYNTSSRYIVTWSNQNASVMLWDLKMRKVTKQLNTTLGGINCAVCNAGDTHVACGGADGDITMINLVSSVALSPMSAPNVQDISALEYNHVRKNMLGAVSNDGSCHLWDCNARKLVRAFTYVHVAPATGVAFSPVNELLLATVGLDKRILLHDSHSKKTVMRIDVEAPLTSVDFLPDGSCICIGSSRGSIYVFDLRSTASPLKSNAAHKTSVQALCFKKASNFSEQDVFVASEDLVSKSTSTVSPVVAPKTGIPLKDANINELIVFSPVQDDEPISTQSPGCSIAESQQRIVIPDVDMVVCSPVQEVKQDPMCIPIVSASPCEGLSSLQTLSIQSPLLQYLTAVGSVPVEKQDSGSVVPNIAASPHQSCSASQMPFVCSPLQGRTNSWSMTMQANTVESAEIAVKLSPAGKAEIQTIMGGSPIQVCASKSNETVTVRESNVTVSEAASSVTVAPEAAASSVTVVDCGNAVFTTGMNAITLRELVRSTVTDVLDDIRDALHQDVVSVHVDMLREFFALKVHIEELFQRCSAMEEMAAEIHRLRRENRNLRRHF